MNVAYGLGTLTNRFSGYRVYLHATDLSALNNGVTMDSLKKYAAEAEAQGGGGNLENAAPVTPSQKGGLATETH